MDDYLPFAVSIILAINAVLFLGQASITNLAMDIGAPAGAFYNSSGSLLCKADAANCTGDYYVLNNTDPNSLFPDNPRVEGGDGNFFTDMFASIKSFFSEKLGLGYVVDILNAPYSFLKMMGLPNEVSFVVSAMWYLLTLFVILAFLWGR